MWQRMTLLLALVVLFSACSQAPAIDLQAEKEQIRQLNQQWYAAENRKDLDAIMQQFLARLQKQTHFLLESLEV